MLADLKEKAAGLDRKRIYTAAAALLVAGTAGHFMQQSSSGSNGPAMMSASVPPVSSPEILPVVPDTTAPETATAAPEVLDGPVEKDSGPSVDLAAAPETPNESTPDSLAADPTPEAVAAAPLVAPRPAPKPTIIPETATASAAPVATTAPAAEAVPVPEEVTRAAADPLLTITDPAPTRDKDAVFAAASDPGDMPPAAAMAPEEPEVAGCAVDVQGTATPGAMMQISIAAPCNSGEPVSFAHAGLKFGERLGPDGTLIVEVPAMTGTAKLALGFADGTNRDIEVIVPDFEAFDRIAVVWQGATGLQLHALEKGADYGEAGHLWSDTPGERDAAVAETGGFVTVLGSTNGYAADIYTYPAALMREGREPEVSIEAQVMENTCGGEIEGWILRSNPNRGPNVEPLSMVVPGCEAVGEFLVLRNLPVNLKLAQR